MIEVPLFLAYKTHPPQVSTERTGCEAVSGHARQRRLTYAPPHVLTRLQ